MISTMRRAFWPATFVLATVVVLVAAAAPAIAGTATGASSAQTDQITVMTRNGPMGTYLTDGQGRSLYRFLADTGTTSTCAGACAAAWPLLITTGAPKAGPGVTAGKLGTTTGQGGTQVTYAGHPLYVYAFDKNPGDTNGQGQNTFGGLWWLVSPNGDSITGSGSAPPSSSPTTSPTGGGGGSSPSGGNRGPGY